MDRPGQSAAASSAGARQHAPPRSPDARERARRLVGWRAPAADQQYLPADRHAPRTRLEFSLRRDYHVSKLRTRPEWDDVGHAHRADDYRTAAIPDDRLGSEFDVERHRGRLSALQLPVVSRDDRHDDDADCRRYVEQLYDARLDRVRQLLGARHEHLGFRQLGDRL